jgi:hypothetical protein
MSTRASVVDREKHALSTHRAALRGSALPRPSDAPKGTFVHGFFLPFTLIVATLRDRELRGPYLRLVLVRGFIVVVIGAIALAKGNIHPRDKSKASATSGGGPHIGVTVHKHEKGEPPTPPVHVDMPGLKVDLDDTNGQASVSVLGQQVPVTNVEHAPDPPAAEAAPAPPPSWLRRTWSMIRVSWAWVLALVAFLSATEGFVVFFSRRWDDWLSFHASRLAAIRPEDDVPKTPKLAIDLGWLYRKMKRRFRGYVVFAAGIPALLVLRVVPVAGEVLFTIALTLWGWYWLGVFSAAKSAHAWADEDKALPPVPIRALNERVSKHFVFAPLRWYGRVWAKITHSVNPAATTFERSPRAFLGLALARVILALPGLYLLARPIVPVAAGRLCAEADPEDRFSVQPPPLLPAP